MTRNDIRMDPTHFDQIVINIAANARDAMPDGGTLTVAVTECGTDGLGGESAAPSAGGGDRWLTLTMTDTGVGMTSDTVERIFEPFYTTKGAEHGTGLGLAVVHSAVHQAAGSIAVTSERGVGTTFDVRLPLWGPRPSTPTTSAPSRLTRNPSVLVALQDDALQALTIRILERAGCTVLAAPEALIDVGRTSATGRVDLVITDGELMDAATGTSVARAARRHRPALPIVYITPPGSERDSPARPGEPSGAALAAPFTAEGLIAFVGQAMDPPTAGGGPGVRGPQPHR